MDVPQNDTDFQVGELILFYNQEADLRIGIIVSRVNSEVFQIKMGISEELKPTDRIYNISKERLIKINRH